MKNHLLFSLLLCLYLTSTHSQKRSRTSPIDEKWYESLTYRNIGPFRGGRSTTVTGVPGQLFTYYMGTTGGGVWKTMDGGTSWQNISDGYFNTTGIGDVTVAPSDPNIIYVGSGEGPVRGVKTSHGDGVYKSTDAGETWTHMGLAATRHISRVYVHPKNPDRVYVAAQGNPWGPNEERGIYMSNDGGKNWQKILYVNENSGIADLTVDSTNPDIMMATSWDFNRKPWVVQSGGPGSRVFKTTDGGLNWKEITKGLPKLKGKMGISISPANPKIVYMAIEAIGKEGGVYRSTDAGESFVQTSNDPTTYARAWYYMHIIADPSDENELWVLNSSAMKSIDGGKTFSGMRGSHVDHHDMWISPEDSNNMINGNDGGGSVTYNGGKTWSTLMNQPTGQFYRVITDNGHPYRVYSGQQDNSSIVIDSRVADDGIGEMHWDVIRAGESATVAVDPNNPRYVYSTYFAGNFIEWDRDIDNSRMVRPYPERVSGEQPKNLKYRANWNGPVIVSPHDPNVIYYGSQFMMKSVDRGVNWEVISQDLTRNDKEHQGKGGIPISNEQITAESYNNIFNIEESPLREGVIWVGSDDGLVHLSQDGGKTWNNVTPEGLKESIINVVEPSPHDAATAYIAVAGYKMNDFAPHIYRTDDYGTSWKKIVNGLPDDTFARTVREDPDRKGLLYAGTETGIFVSFDNGEVWQRLQNNLPEVPITDMRVKRQDLVVATQGRALWILDDLTPLHQISETVGKTDFHLYKPREINTGISVAYSVDNGMGQNPSPNLQIHYVLQKEVGEGVPMSIEIVDKAGNVVFSEFSDRPETECSPWSRPKLKRTAGGHIYEWDMRVGMFDCIKELVATQRNLSAYNAPPGEYKVRLTVGESMQEQNFTIKIHPGIEENIANAAQEYAELDRLSASLYKGATEMSKGVRTLRNIQRQLDFILDVATDQTLKDKGKDLNNTMEEWISHILQKELRTSQHNYQFEARLLIKFKDLLGQMGRGNIPVTAGSKEVTKDYLDQWATLATQLEKIKNTEVAQYNARLKQAGLPEIYMP
ncbi:MAG: glycosyl hydrolase [Sediminicola sp.]